eukprot:m.203780 g.203780  ORF g.203780 m.203780 type:complete len:81 (+) comp14997_c0_seq1:3473-3715(+)
MAKSPGVRIHDTRDGYACVKVTVTANTVTTASATQPGILLVLVRMVYEAEQSVRSTKGIGAWYCAAARKCHLNLNGQSHS